jgi:ketosteroid isomerase-like protein
MTDRSEVEILLRGLYAARVRGDLGRVLETFTQGAIFKIAGSSSTSPISLIAVGIDEFRPWLALMIKTFKLTDQLTLSMLIEGQDAAVHWRARIHSRITGATTVTEFVDLVHIENRRINSYTEFFVPC